nr:homeobox-leucine zipper protein HOX3-like [Setaria viridis]
MEPTGISKSLSGLELAVAAADGNGSNDNGKNATMEIALPDTTSNHPVHSGDGEMQQMDGVGVEEEGGGGSSSQGRNYVRLTREQTDVLEEAFQENQNPETKTKKELAGRINVSLQKVHVWFQTRRARFNQMKRGEEHKEEVISLTNKVSSLNEQLSSQIKTIISLNEQASSQTKTIISLTGQVSSLSEKVISLTGQVSSLAEKDISLSEKVTSLTEEKHHLESELAKLKAAAPPVVPPLPLPASAPAPAPLADEAAFLLPVPGLVQAFVGLCPECASNFRNMRGGGASAAASTSSAPPPPSSSPRLCPDCRSTFRNLAAAVGSLALRQAEAGAGAS